MSVIDRHEIPDSHPLVSNALATHPGQTIVVCLAGCVGAPGGVVYARAHLEPASAPAPSASNTGGREPTESGPAYDEVVCIAGCNGKAGEVVWRGMRLAWVSEQGVSSLGAALREIAARLDGALAPPQIRVWVSAEAARHLSPEPVRALALTDLHPGRL